MSRIRHISFVLMICALLVGLTACSGKNEIKNYSEVLYENGETEFRNYGKGTDENTVYELASNGKVVAAYTALEMVREGILDLDEPIRPYLDPALITNDPRMNDITLRQLLSHTAGFSPNYELGTDKTLYSDPGSRFCYSGVGYIYLQNVIENAGGEPMDQAASRYVFEPLGMSQTTFEEAKTITPYMNLGNASLYALLIYLASFAVLLAVAAIAGKLTGFKYCSFRKSFVICHIAAGAINTLFLLFFFLSKVFALFLICFLLSSTILFLLRKHTKSFCLCAPAVLIAFLVIALFLPITIPVTGNIVPKKANCAYTLKSTAHDMAIFCYALLKKADDADEMFRPQTGIDEHNSWCLGIAVETLDDQKTTYWHSGINPGFQSLLVLSPEQEKYILVLTNSDRGLEFCKDEAREFLNFNGEWEIKRN